MSLLSLLLVIVPLWLLATGFVLMLCRAAAGADHAIAAARLEEGRFPADANPRAARLQERSAHPVGSL